MSEHGLNPNVSTSEVSALTHATPEVAEQQVSPAETLPEASGQSPAEQPTVEATTTEHAPSSEGAALTPQEMPAPPPASFEQPVVPDSGVQPPPATTSEPKPFEKIELPPEPEDKPIPVVVTDELLAQLQGIMERGEAITVHVVQRVRGGLRVQYQGIKMFLPASQFYLKKRPSEQELKQLEGKDIPVHIAEITKDETGRITFIVSRRKLLRDEFYSRFKVGDIVEGTVTAVQEFGLFVDLGGFEGLVHISRVAHRPPANLAELYKPGDVVRAQIVEIKPEEDRISLSIKALEPSPWQTVAERYHPGNRYVGIVRRLAPFGAFVELEPGIEGLVRLRELSWTRRITNPAEVLKEGQQVEVVVLAVEPEKERIELSLRQTTDNPWPRLAAKYPPGFHTTGIVRQISSAGVLLTVGGEVDAFMPRSHMRTVMKGKRIPYHPGDIVAITVFEVDPENESFIVEPRVEPEEELFGPPRDSAKQSSGNKPAEQRQSNPTKITLGELLSEEERRRLFGNTE
ncbi:MAG: S1 RNA-binding domain-containing protein [Chlorobi bacterium]|nr:S1 RNA-binding domain-containing protein [Chlorobiota bacterium]